jgi:hypothetical protein
MAKAINEPVSIGVYTDIEQNMLLVQCVAEHVETKETLVVFTREQGEKAGPWLAQPESAFRAELKHGNYKYHGVKYKKLTVKSLARGFKPGTIVDKKA